MKKYYNKNKSRYWNNYVVHSNDLSFNNDVINDIENMCTYDILEIGNHGKKKKTKNISVKNRDLFTRYKLSSDLAYLQKYKHFISVNPPGKKYLLYIKSLNNKNHCIIINRFKEQKLNYEHQVLKLNMEFNDELYKGTLIDGHVVKKKNDEWYFVAEDIYIYQGNNIMNNSFYERFDLIKNIFKDENVFEEIKNDYLSLYKNKTDNTLYFELKLYVEYKHGLDLITRYYKYLNYNDNNEKFKNNSDEEYNGDKLKGIIFTNVEINATKIYYILPIDDENNNQQSGHQQSSYQQNSYQQNSYQQNSYQQNSYQQSSYQQNSYQQSSYQQSSYHKTSHQQNINIFFKIKNTEKTDVYKLFCKSNGLIIEHGNALIPTLNLSQKIILFFKNIGSNDDIIVRCKFHDNSKQWIPIDKVEENISDINDIIQVEKSCNNKKVEIKKSDYKIPEYDKSKYLLFNEHNKLLDKQFIQDIFDKYKLNFKLKDINNLQTAFVHKTYSKQYYIKEFNKGKNNNNIKLAHSLIDNNIKDCNQHCIDLFDVSNERLEWFGDAKLSDIISTYLEMRYINDDEGFLTELRSKLVRKETLAKLGKQLGFNDYICMAKQIEYFEDGRNSQDNIEDCFEAFIGALYKELKEVNQEYKLTNFIINIYESEINFAELIEQDLNFKKQLMEYYHKKVNKNPIYKEEDKDNDLYNMTVLDPINKGIIGYGSDKLKKKAEMKAAEVALQYLRLL